MNNNAPLFNLKLWREQFIQIILRVAAVFGIVLIGVAFPTATPTDRILFVSIYVFLLGVTLLPVPYALRAYFLLFVNVVIGANAVFAWGPWADGNIFLLSSIVLASLLLDNKTDIFLLAGSFILITLTAVLVLTGNYQLLALKAPETDLAGWQVYIADFAIAGIIITTAVNMLKNAFIKAFVDMQSAFQKSAAERQNLEAAAKVRALELETRMMQLRASTTAASAIAKTQDITALFQTAADLLAGRFEYYHVGVYILDDQKKVAYLQAMAPGNGQSEFGQSVRVETDRKNPLAVVTGKGKTVITTDLEKSAFHQDSNFPRTRSRMVMPLIVRGNLIGMIDMHSDQPDTFTQQDADILQNLVDLTAISFDNARLLDETRNLLSQLEISTSIQTQATWSKLTSRSKSAYQYTPAGVRPVFSQNRTASPEGLKIPVILHGQTIGKINLKKRKGAPTEWSERERELVEKISDQVALALENSRLVDEAQKNALQNQMIANFSTHVRETLDLESVVRTAATELRKVFDLKEAEILIGPAQADPSAQKQ
ncbi:hypothetical protein MASR2M66_08110 [Chloroflexota bacterium]